MDIHMGSNALDPDVVRQLHLMDKAIEHQYGVKHLHYYVNPEEGMGFCLLSGPDKETCAKVHEASHGNVASNIIEVEDTVYKSFMGKVEADAADMIQSINGQPDPGYRVVLYAELVGISDSIPRLTDLLVATVVKNGGRLVELTRNSIVCSFTDGNSACYAAGTLTGFAKEYKREGLDLKIGLATGNPVTQHGATLFEETVALATKLAYSAPLGGVLASSKTSAICQGNRQKLSEKFRLSFLRKSQEEFINKLFYVLDQQINSGLMSVENLCLQLGVSRSQLYRKIGFFSGASPKEFIREFRLTKGLNLIETTEQTVSETAYQLGFNKPAIFSKQFKDRFGVTPSSAKKLLTS
ncbi:MAG: hypothetical protein DHS20C17_20330 [Cyclobacteriaceae bacterium]|nr:MAG: hypothetical protein DHS20C17_20330 [Cyclobacteriaceae bacterium]